MASGIFSKSGIFNKSAATGVAPTPGTSRDATVATNLPPTAPPAPSRNTGNFSVPVTAPQAAAPEPPPATPEAAAPPLLLKPRHSTSYSA